MKHTIKTPLTFPIKIRMSANALKELHSCEYGSYEDHIKSDGAIGERREGEYGIREFGDHGDYPLHIVEIIERSKYKTVVEIRKQQELDEFISASLTGTFGLYCLGTCRRLYKSYIDSCTPERVRWVSYGTLGY